MSKVLVGLTGSIACFKVATLISSLVKDGHQVRCIATPSALKFIGEATLEGLTGEAVYKDLWGPGKAMDHIHLGRWADLVLVAPCTANTLNKLHIGLADDLLTSLLMALEKQVPIFIAPAMNKEMWSHPTTLESVKKLRQRGHHIIPPGAGALACGEIGDGRLAEPEEILRQIFQNDTSAPKVLITGGGTREPIDGVRYIGNSSTGRTSATLAAELSGRGFNVSLLRADYSEPAPHGIAETTFTDFTSLQALLQSKLAEQEWDAVIHAAAVSDFSVTNADTSRKLPTQDQMSLNLKANPKLLSQLRRWSKNPAIKVFGFKLTKTDSEIERVNAIHKLFHEDEVDYVIHNDLIEINQDEHPFRLLKNDQVLAAVKNAKELAMEIAQHIGGTP